MNSSQSGKKLAKKMIIALICGLIVGFGCILLRENLLANGQESLWNTINNVLFQDITAEGANSAIGLFYIVGQLFVNALIKLLGITDTMIFNGLEPTAPC